MNRRGRFIAPGFHNNCYATLPQEVHLETHLKDKSSDIIVVTALDLGVSARIYKTFEAMAVTQLQVWFVRYSQHYLYAGTVWYDYDFYMTPSLSLQLRYTFGK
jgi:hypothetical protein